MKTIKYMIAAASISAACFMGCTKQSSPESGLITAADAKTATTIDGNASVNFQLQVLLPPAAMVKWSAGQITVSEDILDVSRAEGNMVQKFTLTAPVGKTFDLFSNPVIGSVNVPYYAYFGLATSIGLFSPSPNADISMALSGVYSNGPGNIAIPLRVVINQPVTLNSLWLGSITINTGGYTALMLLDMGQVTAGITREMFAGAQISNGTIVISSTSNANLYAMIISNLQNMNMNLQLSAQSGGNVQTQYNVQPNTNTAQATVETGGVAGGASVQSK